MSSSKRKYFTDGDHHKYKIKIKSILPHPPPSIIKHKKLWKKVLPKKLSLVFTHNYLLFKKKNKKIIEIPYRDIDNWGGYGKYWSFSWKLSDYTLVYVNHLYFLDYFTSHNNCIVYIKNKNGTGRSLNNSLIYFKTRIQKHYF